MRLLYSVLIAAMDFLTRRSLYKEALLSYLHAQPDLYLLTGIPGNIGDHLIWRGATDLLTYAGIRYTPISLPRLDAERCLESTLLVPGSGAFSKSYHEWLPATILKASSRFRDVVILPSGFDPTVPIVSECLSQKNVFAFARETGSYRSIKAFGRAALSLDCAIYYRKFDNLPASIEQPSEDDRMLLALRTDKDSLLSTQGLVPNPTINQDISLTKSNLDEWIEAIMRHATVITDRLHVAVASVLLGKNLIYLDPDRLKISTYFDFNFRDAFNDRVRRCSSAWLLENNLAVKSVAS